LGAQIIIKAETTSEYAREVTNRSQSLPLKYHFIKGIHYPGHIKDPSLEKVGFREITLNLASHLTIQNYFPNKDTDNKDVMIFVYWGLPRWKKTQWVCRPSIQSMNMRQSTVSATARKKAYIDKSNCTAQPMFRVGTWQIKKNTSEYWDLPKRWNTGILRLKHELNWNRR
tara:strand:- start:4016 stop:4525 length:510 start_codon:yes stop_codon:yes gene_type:complete